MGAVGVWAGVLVLAGVSGVQGLGFHAGSMSHGQLPPVSSVRRPVAGLLRGARLGRGVGNLSRLLGCRVITPIPRPQSMFLWD